MNFYSMKTLYLLAFSIIALISVTTFFYWCHGVISTKKAIIRIVKILVVVLLFVIFSIGLLSFGKIPTDKTTYTEVITARYIQQNDYSLFHSRQYEYIEATFEIDGQTVRYKFPLNDVEVQSDKDKSMVQCGNLFYPYILIMTEDDYNNALNIHSLKNE